MRETKVPGKENIFKVNTDFNTFLNRVVKVNTKDLQTPPKELIRGKKATPFVKWVGGKRSIIKELTSRLPNSIADYYEAFAGGGALFFELADSLEKAHLTDINFDLLISYNVIKKDLDKLIKQLTVHKSKHSDEYYYKIRAKHELQDPIAIAARFIYLNKTCFNGLFRVNKKGEFNVPVGKYANPGIVQEDNLKAVSEALEIANVNLIEFDQITPSKGDFVYFDPPYHPTDSASFTTYTKSDFTEVDQVRLRDFALQLNKDGVSVMLSNSNTKFIRDLYSNACFNINIVNAPRSVNCKPNKRGAVEEVLITNYETRNAS